MGWRQLLGDARRWRQAEEGPRAEALEALALELGLPWRHDRGWMHHGRRAFLPVPGGVLWMGFSVEDVMAACRARTRRVDADCGWAPDIAAARPPRPVAIAPFLISRSGERGRSDHDVSRPYRLPTDAELEWVFRGFGRSHWIGVDEGVEITPRNCNQRLLHDTVDGPYGLQEVYDEKQLCETDGVRRTRLIHTMWQDDDEELLGVHSAVCGWAVTYSTRAVLRPVFPLPTPAPDVSAFVAPDETASLLEALQSAKKVDQTLAGSALYLLARAPGPDLEPVVRTLIAEVPKGDKRLKAAAGATRGPGLGRGLRARGSRARAGPAAPGYRLVGATLQAVGADEKSRRVSR